MRWWVWGGSAAVVVALVVSTVAPIKADAVVSAQVTEHAVSDGVCGEFEVAGELTAETKVPVIDFGWITSVDLALVEPDFRFAATEDCGDLGAVRGTVVVTPPTCTDPMVMSDVEAAYFEGSRKVSEGADIVSLCDGSAVLVTLVPPVEGPYEYAYGTGDSYPMGTVTLFSEDSVCLDTDYFVEPQVGNTVSVEEFEASAPGMCIDLG